MAHLREVLLQHVIPGWRPIETFLADGKDEEMVLMMNGEWQNVELNNSTGLLSFSPSLNVLANVIRVSLLHVRAAQIISDISNIEITMFALEPG